MKKLGLTILLAALFPLMLWAQTEHKVYVNTLGGGESTGGVYQNFGVAGQTAQQESASGGSTETSVGFLYAADDAFGSNPPCFIPMGFENSALGETTASFAWSAEAGLAYDYRLALANESLENAPIENLGQVGTLDLTGLIPGAGYQIQLRTNCTVTQSEWTEPLVFETFGLPDCEAPASLTIAIADDDVSLLWPGEASDPQSNYPIYSVAYRSANDQDWTEITNLSSTSTLIENLAPNTYQVRIGKQCSASGQIIFGSTYLFEIENPCLPTRLSFITSDANSISVSWQDIGSDDYEIRYRKQNSFDWINTVGAGSGPTTTIGSLEDGTVYELQLRSICSGNLSSFGESLFAQTEGIPCQVPTDLVATDITETTALLSWGQTNALYYDVRYRRQGTAAWSSFQTFDLSRGVEGLIGGTTYVFEVSSVCDFNEPGSAWSTRQSFTTLPATIVCDMPVAVSATSQSPGELSFSWLDVDPLDEPTAYELRYRLASSNVWNTRILAGSKSSLDIQGLNEASVYEYQLRSRCGETGEISSDWTALSTVTTQGTPCETPTNLTAQENTGDNTVIDLAFDDVAENYLVRYKATSFPFWNSIVLNGTSNNGTFEASIFGLESGVTYELSVATVCNGVNSGFSAPVTVTLSSPTPCLAPSNISFSPGVGSVASSWDDLGSDYLVRYRLKGTTTWVFVETSTNSFSTSNLEPGMTYQFQVKSLCGEVRQSEYSLLAEFTTQGLPSCVKPVVTNTAADQNSITLSWIHDDNSAYYLVQYRVAGTAQWNTRQVFDPAAITMYNYTIANLQSGTAYQFRVQAVCSEDGLLKSEYSNIGTESTQGQASCEIPTGFVATAGQSDATISWVTQAAAASYQLRYRLAGSAAWSVVSTANTSINLTGLVSGANYQYQVRAICDTENFFASVYSQIQTFATEGPQCLAPVASVSGSPGTSTTISWIDAAEGAAAEEYVYRYRLLGVTEWTQGVATSNQTTLTGLLEGQTYQFRVSAVCDGQNQISSAFSEFISFTVPGQAAPCVVPDGLGQNDATATSAIISWNDIGAPYDLQYRKDGGLWITLLDVNLSNGVFSINNLDPGTTYEWRVRATCSSGANSDFSAPATLVTDPAQGLEMPLADIKNNKGSATADSESSTMAEDVPNSEAMLSDAESIAELGVELYPNPFRDRFFIRLENPIDAHITMDFFNLAGIRVSPVFEGLLEGNRKYEFTVDGRHLLPGVYLVVINGVGGQRTVKKVILQQ